MSLNQISTNTKNALNVKFNNIELEGNELGRVVEGNLTFANAIVASPAYRAEILGNVCVLRIAQANPVASASDTIESTDFPAELLPASKAEGCIMVEDNATRVAGCYAIDIGASGQLLIEKLDANNNPADFSGAGTTGWARPLVLTYLLN